MGSLVAITSEKFWGQDYGAGFGILYILTTQFIGCVFCGHYSLCYIDMRPQSALVLRVSHVDGLCIQVCLVTFDITTVVTEQVWLLQVL